MLIVASNSLTISNVNDGAQGIPGKPGADGKTPYLHTAYSWSADGTDRFMTVYPQENLLSNSSFESDKYQRDTVNTGRVSQSNEVAYSGTYSLKVTATYSGDHGYSIHVSDPLPNTSYTFSGYLYSDSDKVVQLSGYSGGWASLGRQNVSLKAKTWTSFTYKLTTTTSLDNVRLGFFMNADTTAFYIDNVKIELGETATPWTPTSSEDYQAAYPSYRGEYTDYTQADSDDPTKYEWALIKGANGAKGQSVWSYPYNRGANRLGNYWSDLKPAPTTDNPPKVGDTVIDMIGNMYQITNVVVGTTQQGGGTFDYGALITSIKGNDGIAGKDGVGVKATAITYAQSTSGTTPPTTGWTAGVPTLTKGQYLWTKTVWTYTDSSAETGYTVSYNAKDGNNGSDGIAGKDGVGIKSTTITYQSGTSGTVQPTGTWVSSPPSVTGGNYLWTRTVWSYTDGTNETGYSIAKAGEKGDQGLRGLQGADGKDGVAGKDGVGIKSTAVTYQASTSGTTAPTGTWVASPTAVAGQYQWTRTVWTYTDGTTEVGYSVGHIGVDGATGKDGIAGKDGVGIKSTTITYASSTSGTSAPTSGWVSTPPSATAGQFIWTRTIWTYTDNTTETGYSVGKIGEKGETGANGAPGKPGADGKTPYFHQAWADSKDGKI